ncbi:energy transducer TonB [soil metagenome]
MDTNMVLNASFNELVFENRHKNYGAYQIRKRYSRNVLLAAFFAVTLFSIALGTYFINMPESNAAMPTSVTTIHDSVMIIGNPPVYPPIKPVVTKPPAPKGSSNTITSNIVITKDSLSHVDLTSTPGNPNGSEKGIGLLKDTGTVAVNPCPNCKDTIPKKPKFRDWLPFPPKDPGLDAFFVKNIKYPQAAKDDGIQGTVVLTFIVDTKGDVRDIKIAKGVNPLLDREVLRVAKFMPKWEPVKDENGEIVEYLYNKPVRFILK